MARQRKNQKAKAARADSGSEVEEIPRKNLMDQIGANLPHIENGVPFDLKHIQGPLADALSKDQKKKKGGKITYESYNIPSGLPDRTGPKNKFLKEKGRKKDDDDKEEEEEEEDDIEVIGDAGQTFFFSIPLTMMLFAFYILVQKQYLEETDYWESIWRCIGSFPVIWFILYLTHPRKTLVAMQAVFVAIAVLSGCWMIYNVNYNGYYAIMKMVPPLGTMLVYSVIQMDIVPSVTTLAVIGVYCWYNDLVLFSV